MRVGLTCKSTENCVKCDIGMTFCKDDACNTKDGFGAVRLHLWITLLGGFVGVLEGCEDSFLAFCFDGVVGVLLLVFVRGCFLCGSSELETSDVLEVLTLFA